MKSKREENRVNQSFQATTLTTGQSGSPNQKPIPVLSLALRRGRVYRSIDPGVAPVWHYADQNILPLTFSKGRPVRI